jgi:hypothetical protein
MGEVIRPVTITAEDRLDALYALLDAGTATVEEVDELVDLMGLLGMTLTSAIPERLRSQTRH